MSSNIIEETKAKLIYQINRIGTQRKVADILEVDESYISRVKNGEVNISFEKAWEFINKLEKVK